MQEQGDEETVEGQQQGGNQGIGSPISNDAYNILSALHSKLEASWGVSRVPKDGDQAVWRELTQSDLKCVEELWVRSAAVGSSAAALTGCYPLGQRRCPWTTTRERPGAT